MTKKTNLKNLYFVRAKEGWRLIIETVVFVYQNRKFFIGLIIIYALLTYFLVGGISQVDYAAIKKQSTNITNGLDVVTTVGAYFGAVITGGLNQAPNTIQQLLSGLIDLIFWLAVVWATRMITAYKAIKLRDAFYSGMTPIVSTIVVLLVVTLQLIPAALGLYGITIGITYYWIQTPLEALAFGGATFLLCLLSFYWLTGSVVGLAVVALPGMYPLRALGEARVLSMGRRWDIAMRVLVLLFILLLIWAAILMPAFFLDRWINISWLPLIPLVVQLLGGFSVMFVCVYVYKLYRSLLV